MNLRRHILLLRWLLPAVLLLAGSWRAGAQIVNRLKVDANTFQRYAYGRMQPYHSDNLALADSIYNIGVQKQDYRYKCLGLSLEFPVRFALGEYERMDEAAAEIKALMSQRKDSRSFYFTTLHEYCEYLVHIGRSSDAMLEARAMERIATEEKRPVGRMYSYRIIGLIQSYRSNSYLAIRNFEQAVDWCKQARQEQELPGLYLLLSQEYTRSRDFAQARYWCDQAEKYEAFFPSIRLRAQMTRAYIYEEEGDDAAFWRCYDALLSDPVYTLQTGADDRYALDITYLESKGLLEEALAKADSLSTSMGRHDRKHGLYAARGDYADAYSELDALMAEKDSIYIKVQNEDLAILDAEMHNAELRQEAEALKHRQQNLILLGFIAMFAIAFFSILISQWQLRENLDELRRRNGDILEARKAYQKALDAKEAENSMKIRILQNRKSNTLKL